MPKKRKKVLKPLPEVPEAKTSLSVYLWLAVDTSFQTYWQGKRTNKQFTLSRRNNQVINLPSTEKGHIVYSRQITKYIAMSEHETAIPRKDRIWFLVLNLPFCHPSQLTQNLWMLSSLLFIVFTKFYQVLKKTHELVHAQMPWYTNLNIQGCKKSQCYMYNRSSFGQAVASIYLQLERLFDQPVKSEKKNKYKQDWLQFFCNLNFP